MCIEDVATLVCKKCHDWANNISETVHGPMVQNRDLKQGGMKLVQMINDGKLDHDGFDKLWNEARYALRGKPDSPQSQDADRIIKQMGASNAAVTPQDKTAQEMKQREKLKQQAATLFGFNFKGD